MKKFLILLVLVFPILLFVSCGGKKDPDTADTAPDDGSDTNDTTSDTVSDTASDADQDTNGGDTAPDSDDPDTVPTDDEPEKNEDGCYIFTVDGSTFSKYYSNTYLGYVKDNILGDRNMTDKFEIDTFQPRTSPGVSHPGTYDLGSGDNKSYYDCTECVKVMQDHDGKHADKLFFQESGTLIIEEVDGDNNIKGRVSAKLVEVTIDDDLGEAVPVENGGCVAIENWAFDTGVCIPDCEGKVCGSDGCGGTCGECSGDLTCPKDQKSCVPYDCKKITFDEMKLHINEFDSYYYKTKVSDNAIGSTALEDIMTLQFYGDGYTLKEGTIDLGSGDNANYETCVECLLLYEDVDFYNNEYGRTFFQQKGELVFDEVKEGTFESRGHASFRLVEVEIDDYSSVSTPVPGGACYEVENLTWDTICTPQCDGRVCGPDGCGGECGENGAGCGPDMACSADQQSCVEWNCEKITLEDLTENDVSIYPLDGIYNYMYPITPNIGKPEITETLQLGLRGNIQEKRPYKLYGTNLRSSDVSFVLYADGTELYFQHSGTVTFDPFDFYTGVFEATLDSLRLVQVRVDEDLTSIPVPGGKCIEITNTILEYKTGE